MARKRMIDPEYWSDEEIGKWSFEARLFYIGLWNFSDDEGRFKAHPDLLKSHIFPYDKKIDIEKLKKELNHKIQWYEVEGLQYGYVRNFLNYQRIDRPTESKLPIPPPFVEQSSSNQELVPPNISKVKLSKVKLSKVKLSKVKLSKDKYLDFVLLTKDEHQKLVDKFGDKKAEDWIETLNNGIGSKGYVFESHYYTILAWDRKDMKQKIRDSGSRKIIIPAHLR